MARLKLIRFSLSGLKGLNKEKAITFINWIIFASFFALSASIISMFYENRIDEIDNKIINEETNILVYENQINITPLVLKNIENVFQENYRTQDYIQLLKLWNDDETIVTNRVTAFYPYKRYEAAANYGLEQIKQSMTDAILVAKNTTDIAEIEKNNIEFYEIVKEIREINSTRQKLSNEWALKDIETEEEKNTDGDDKDKYYQKYSPLNDRLIQSLQSQINFLTNFNIKYFSRKKNETENGIFEMEKELERLSKQESLIIFGAFILQLIVFLSVQYFEVTMETANAKRTKKKL